jgi:hypothetical protein
MRIAFRLAAAVIALLISSGCAMFLVGAGAAIGAGTLAYVEGELQAGDNVGLDHAWSATTQAMEDLKLKVTQQQRDELGGQVIARTSDDKKVLIRLKKQSDSVTEFRIRVGTIGDEALARLIHDKIKTHF